MEKVAFTILIQEDALKKHVKILLFNLCKYFRPKNEDEICASKSENDGCEIKKCSELSSDKCN
jgi:hypothetical protein